MRMFQNGGKLTLFVNSGERRPTLLFLAGVGMLVWCRVLVGGFVARPAESSPDQVSLLSPKSQTNGSHGHRAGLWLVSPRKVCSLQIPENLTVRSAEKVRGLK